MKIKPIDAAVAVALTALGLAACSPDAGDNRTAGQKVDNAIESTQTALNNAGQATTDAVGSAVGTVRGVGAALGETAARAAKSTEEAAITASIKTDLLKDPELSALKIEVDTNGSVVTLNGVAPNELAADRAARIAIAQKGVTEVRNHVVARKG